jgi:hypothetical protein
MGKFKILTDVLTGLAVLANRWKVKQKEKEQDLLD